MKTTPGPWKKNFALTGGGHEIVTVSSPVQHGGGFYEVCRMYLDDEPADSVERIAADFDMLAAAPELLAALMVLVADVERMSELIGANMDERKHADAARAAIAKATGENVTA
jgi:acetoacetate decarboxylase